jgi:beta-glucosidase
MSFTDEFELERLSRRQFLKVAGGTTLGAEIAQVYLGLPASMGEPPRRLVGWTKIELEPGETKEVSVTLDPNASSRPFSYWNVNTNCWEVASGDFQVYVGASSRDIRLTGSLRVHSARP